LDIAKKVKFYPQLAKIVIKIAFQKAKDTGNVININLSIQDITNKDIVKMIEEELKKDAIAHLITFELLESENITDYEKVISFISIVKKLGCRIAIDDFGSGYSNFAYIIKLNPDYIKIDGSLIENMLEDKKIYILVKSIIELAHEIDIEVIAEFISSPELYNALDELGVDAMQGYYLGKPERELQQVITENLL